MEIIIIALIILVLITKVEFRIENKVHDTDVYLKIAGIFTIQIDYEKYIRHFVTSKEDRTKISVREIIENSRKLKSAEPFIRNLCRHMYVRELTVVNRYTDRNPYIAVANYTAYAYLSNYMHGLFRVIENEKYLTINENEIDVDFVCITSIRVVNTIIVLLENIKKLPLLFKRVT